MSASLLLLHGVAVVTAHFLQKLDQAAARVAVVQDLANTIGCKSEMEGIFPSRPAQIERFDSPTDLQNLEVHITRQVKCPNTAVKALDLDVRQRGHVFGIQGIDGALEPVYGNSL